MEPTPKQVALLSYLGEFIPGDRRKAAEAIDNATNDPKHRPRLGTWRMDRLWLHPDLYASELHAFKNRRVGELLRANNCERGPGEPLRELSREQVQAVVDWLDSNHPTWDRYFYNDIGWLDQDLFYEGFVPLAAQLLDDVVKRGYGHVRHKTPTFP